MRRATCRAAFAALATFGAAGTATAACEGVTVVAPGNAVLNYDPFDELRETLDVDLIVRQRGTGACQLAFAVQSLVPGVYREMRGGNVPVRYELRLGPQLLQNDLTSPVTVPGSVPGGGRDTPVRLRFELPPGMLLPAGQYADVLTVRAFDVSTGPPVGLGVDTSFTARLVVPASVRILMDGGVAASNERFGLSMIFLGELSNGAQADATLQIRATSGVRLSIVSRNRGVLQHLSVPGDAGAIRYGLSVDGRPVDLRAGPAMLNRMPPGGAGRENVRLQISVPRPSAQRAGTYRDTLTVTAEPN